MVTLPRPPVPVARKKPPAVDADGGSAPVTDAAGWAPMPRSRRRSPLNRLVVAKAAAAAADVAADVAGAAPGAEAAPKCPRSDGAAAANNAGGAEVATGAAA